MSAYAELARPLNAGLASFSALLGMIVVLEGDILDWDLLVPITLGMVVPFLVTSGGNALNDYMDQDVDKRAHPGRPIPSGRLAPDKVLWFSIGCFVLAQPLAGAIVWFGHSNVLPLLVELLAVGSLLAYELRLKYRGLSGNLTVSWLSALTLVFGATCVAEPDVGQWSTVLVLFVLAFFASAGREVTKDIQDMASDSGQRETLPMTSGVGRASGAVTAFIITAVVLSPVPFWPLGSMEWPYLAVVAVADVVFLYSLALLRKDPKGAQGIHKAGMMLALFAFLVGSLAGGFM
jgi:geranylgeranylglycerol-phosphate geranylgeranyltransferase